MQIMFLKFPTTGRIQKCLSQLQNILDFSPLKEWEVLRNKCLYLEQYGIVCKKFQKVQPEAFLKSFSFSYYFYHRPNFYLSRPTYLSQLPHLNCVSSTRVTEPLQKSVFTWRDRQLWVKCFCQKYRNEAKLQKTRKILYPVLWNFWTTMGKLHLWVADRAVIYFLIS